MLTKLNFNKGDFQGKLLVSFFNRVWECRKFLLNEVLYNVIFGKEGNFLGIEFLANAPFKFWGEFTRI